MNKAISRKVILTLSLLTFGFSLMAIDFEKLNTELNDYYVKVDGTGDGSSWDKAMGNKEFSYMLGHVREGATFHLAAGTYVPVLNSAYEEVTDSDLLVYQIIKSVNIIGGYPKNPTEKDVSNPKENITLFTSDVNGDNKIDDLENYREDDLDGCLYIDRVDGKVLLYGLQFGGTANHSSTLADANAICHMSSSVVNVENCSFLGCHNPLKIERCDATITNCIFGYNNNSFVTSIGDVKITSTTFKNEGYTTICSSYRYGYMGGGIDAVQRTVSVTNCTFKDVKNLKIGDSSDSKHTKYYFNNNTILMDEGSVTLCCMTTMTGNIISALGIILRGESYGKMVQPLYNVICTNDLDDDNIIKSESSNIWVTSYSSFLSSELKNNGGYTPTLALKSDELSNGKSLRFPLSETTVTSDQRYMKRSQKTCVGAYELDATETVPVVRQMNPDTIVACDVYPLTGKSYPIGCSMVRETIKNVRGKDSLVLVHPVYVLPDPAQKVYYVKQNGEGDKSGKSWDNAMNDSSFAYALLKLSSDDVTFHIAEGEYKPIYDSLGNISDDKRMSVFYAKRNASLIGGYSTSSPSSMPEPHLYVTTFSGYMQENLYVRHILRYMSLKNKKVNVKGIRFIYCLPIGESDEGGLVLSATQNCDFSVEKCTFENVYKGINVNTQSGRTNSDLKLIVKDCYSKADMVISGENVTIENSSFVTDKFNLSGLLMNLSIKNSTFYINDFRTYDSWTKNAFSAQLINNTILLKSNLSLIKGVYSFVGNILKGPIVMEENSNVTSSYNVYSNDNEQYVFISDKDIILKKEQFGDILDNSNDEWNFRYQGGFTPTVAPLTDSLSDGTTILFPLSATSVETDQRGAKRNELTCMGACEIISDTIIVTNPNSIDVPTLFTPYDFNGKNDVFMPGCEVYIYNLYGGLICHSTNGWDGRKDDELVPAGTYVYVLVKGDEKKKGTIILSR